MPLQQTSGNVTQDAYGGGVAVEPVYIEQIFSTWLYTGNGSTQTITNGIDLAGKGGLVWTKSRTEGTWPHILAGTNFSAPDLSLSSNNTNALASNSDVTSWNSNGYTMSVNSGYMNYSGPFVSWTFRKQPKFFDVLTYTGDGVTGRQIPHNLGSVPGCIIIKRTDTTAVWTIFHAGLSGGITGSRILFDTAAATAGSNITAVDASTFTVISTGVNSTGATYVAYLFAHNAGGFGLTGTDNVISCGSFTTDGSGNASVNLGYEPQWLMWKRSDGASSWRMLDSMRGFNAQPSTSSVDLEANTSSAEYAFGLDQSPNATGFAINAATSSTYIYIAIRRGPMKVPTDGTKVFSPNTYTGNGSTGQTFTNTVNNGGSLVVIKGKNSTFSNVWYDQLRGAGDALASNSTSSELLADPGYEVKAFTNTGFSLGGNFNYDVNNTSAPFVYWQFVRAPSFFDEVCYTGNGDASAAYTHNLTVVPELMLVKNRSNDNRWFVYSSFLTATSYLILNTNEAAVTHYRAWYNIPPTSTTFTVSSLSNNATANNYVNYLFATVAGVSKVGNYTGNGSTQTINCGFTGGARFVLIKRTDSTGDWYVYDTARGMTTLTDPYLLLNSTAAETATLGSVTTVTTGFAVNAAVLAAINTNAASYIFLAIS